MERAGVQLLAVEDDADSAAQIARACGQLAWQFSHVENIDDALTTLAQRRIDIVLLDRMLENGSQDGLSLIAQMKAHEVNIPVVIMSSLGSPSERIKGLEEGADVYMSKPVSSGEIAAQLAATMRRLGVVGSSAPILQVGRLVIHREIDVAKWQGARLATTRKTFALLVLLAENSGECVGRQRIWDTVWPDQRAIGPQDKVIDRVVSRLRMLFREVSADQPIESCRGRGFTFNG